MENKLTVIYDSSSMPEGLNLENIYNIMENSGIVVWDSNMGGKEPQVLDTQSLRTMDVNFLSIKEIVEKFSNIS